MQFMTAEQARQHVGERRLTLGSVVCKTGMVRSTPALVREVDTNGYATGRYIGLDRGTYEQIRR